MLRAPDVPEMIEDGGAVPDRTRVRDGAGDVLLRGRGRLVKVASQREPGRERRRKGAAGSVRTRSVQPAGPQLDEGASVEKQVDHIGAGVMTAGDDHCGRAHV